MIPDIKSLKSFERLFSIPVLSIEALHNVSNISFGTFGGKYSCQKSCVFSFSKLYISSISRPMSKKHLEKFVVSSL